MTEIKEDEGTNEVASSRPSIQDFPLIFYPLFPLIHPEHSGKRSKGSQDWTWSEMQEHPRKTWEHLSLLGTGGAPAWK